MEVYLSDFLTLIIAHFFALLSPGADFFIIVSNSTKYGKSIGILTSIGIAFANLLYILLALFGIALIKENVYIFSTIKFLGSLYLIYISYHLFKSKKIELVIQKKSDYKRKMSIKYFSMGFLSAILNPKNSIFYFTMFSISTQNSTPLNIQFIYALWMFLAVLFWDIFIVNIITNKKAKTFINNYSNYIEKTSAIILFSIGITIIISMFI